jgi:hypothetical protein
MNTEVSVIFCVFVYLSKMKSSSQVFHIDKNTFYSIFSQSQNKSLLLFENNFCRGLDHTKKLCRKHFFKDANAFISPFATCKQCILSLLFTTALLCFLLAGFEPGSLIPEAKSLEHNGEIVRVYWRNCLDIMAKSLAHNGEIVVFRFLDVSEVRRKPARARASPSFPPTSGIDFTKLQFGQKINFKFSYQNFGQLSIQKRQKFVCILCTIMLDFTVFDNNIIITY